MAWRRSDEWGMEVEMQWRHAVAAAATMGHGGVVRSCDGHNGVWRALRTRRRPTGRGRPQTGEWMRIEIRLD